MNNYGTKSNHDEKLASWSFLCYACSESVAHLGLKNKYNEIYVDLYGLCNSYCQVLVVPIWYVELDGGGKNCEKLHEIIRKQSLVIKPQM